MENKNFKPTKKNNKIKNNNNQNISLNLKDNEKENKNKKNNNIYVINNIYIKNKNDVIKKENIKKNNENIKENDIISASSKRLDRLGNEIKKGGIQKICFIDKIDNKKLVITENIESYKDYNKSEETTSNTKSLCCLIY